MIASLRTRLRDPLTWTSVVQLLKTVAAAVIAWMLAVHVFGIAQPFLAPWAALLTVHATVVGTVRRGAEQVGASVIGVLLAFGAGRVFGSGAVALAVVVLIGLIVGMLPRVRVDATTAAATALVVLTAGYSSDGGMLAARLLDTGIGIAVGLLVNLAVWPPLRDRGAASAIDQIDDRIGRLLCDIAAALRRRERAVDDWVACTGELDGDIDEAWRVLGQAHESGRLNPRRATRWRMRAAEDFAGILRRLEQAVADMRSMAQTIGLAPGDWDPAFREPWVELLERAGAAVSEADAATLAAVHEDLDTFAGHLDLEALPERFWPISGALIVNLRNIIDALGEVAEAQPVEVPTPAALPA
jgi:uncharacterized membrane protein YccC